MTSGFVFWVISMERILKKRYLFDFESLVDTKVGCVRYILNSKKLNTSYIKPCMLEPTLALLKQLSVGSVERNPVKWILKDEYSDSADDLYKIMLSDKKIDGAMINLVIPKRIGEAVLNKVSTKELRNIWKLCAKRYSLS